MHLYFYSLIYLNCWRWFFVCHLRLSGKSVEYSQYVHNFSSKIIFCQTLICAKSVSQQQQQQPVVGTIWCETLALIKCNPFTLHDNCWVNGWTKTIECIHFHFFFNVTLYIVLIHCTRLTPSTKSKKKRKNWNSIWFLFAPFSDFPFGWTHA